MLLFAECLIQVSTCCIVLRLWYGGFQFCVYKCREEAAAEAGEPQYGSIAPATAQECLQMRKSYGPFKGVDDLLAVGYKIFDRCQECGIQGLTDRSRRPYRYANQLPFQVQNYILNVKHEHPSPGGPQNQRTSDPQTVDGPCAHR